MEESLQKLVSELEYIKRNANKAMLAAPDHDSPAYQFHYGRFALCCHLLSKIDQLKKK